MNDIFLQIYLVQEILHCGLRGAQCKELPTAVRLLPVDNESPHFIVVNDGALSRREESTTLFKAFKKLGAVMGKDGQGWMPSYCQRLRESRTSDSTAALLTLLYRDV